MTLVYDNQGIQVWHDDCLNVLRAMREASVDSVVTDPPSGTAFTGADWDLDRGGRDHWVAWLTERMQEALRALKPGGNALVWALPRTSYWTALALDDAGFEIRDCITHLFGTGFPKSLNVSRSVDMRVCSLPGIHLATPRAEMPRDAHVCPQSREGERWSGFGSALKPASEHWWLCRKPLDGTVASNILMYDTGALNIGSCLVGTTGRWPANVVLSHSPVLDSLTGEVIGDACEQGCVEDCPVAELDRQSGIIRASDGKDYSGGKIHGTGAGVTYLGKKSTGRHHGDIGGASRFFTCFRWENKSPRKERPRVNGVAWPTVKSVALTRWLCCLATPPGGVILDMFAGTGTTGQAAHIEGYPAILIEQNADAIALSRARLDEQFGLWA